MLSGKVVTAADLAGKRVVAASAIGDPEAFVAQIKATGAQVQVATWNDHHGYATGGRGVARAGGAQGRYLVVTEKDAVKLRDRWPASVSVLRSQPWT